VALLSASAASAAAANATWAGAQPLTSTASNDPAYLWSHGGANGLNWSGGTVPGSSVGVLSFPDLPACDVPAPTTACYTSFDDLGPIDASQLSFGGSATTLRSYNIYSNAGSGSSVTLSGDGNSPNIGLTGQPPTGSADLQLATWGIPIVLGADQQWNISGNNPPYGGGILDLNTVSGPHNLTLNLTDQGTIEANSVTTAPVTVDGDGTLQLDYLQGSKPNLPEVTLANDNSALVIATPGATSGAINVASTATGNQFYVLTDGVGGSGQSATEATLAAGGDVTLNAGTTMEFDIDGNDTSAGVNASQLTDAGGTVNFGGGAALSLWQAQDAGKCVALATGNTYTLVSAHALSGSISVGGKVISQGQSATETLKSNSVSNCTNAAKTTVIVSYNANTITATIAGAPVASTTPPKIGGTATVGDKLTVTDNGTWTAAPAPTYSYQWESCSGSSCAKIAGATGSSYTLTSAEVGKKIKAQVTATNSYGSASAFSNTLGPVTATTSSSGGPSLRTLIRRDLARLGHPRGRRAILALLRSHSYRTSFRAQVGGTLSDVWTASIRTGHGRHARRHTFVVAAATVHIRANHRTRVTVRLTSAGRRLLREHLFSLRTTARERYLVRGLGWTTFTRRFTL
jgi:hypothetical protein